MESIAESHIEVPSSNKTNWTPVIAIIVALISLAVSGLVGYGHDQSDLRVKNAVTGATALTPTDLQPFREKDTALEVAVGVLQSQRTEDHDRLIRIEDKVDKLLSQPGRIPSRNPVPNVRAQEPR